MFSQSLTSFTFTHQKAVMSNLFPFDVTRTAHAFMCSATCFCFFLWTWILPQKKKTVPMSSPQKLIKHDGINKDDGGKMQQPLQFCNGSFGCLAHGSQNAIKSKRWCASVDGLNSERFYQSLWHKFFQHLRSSDDSPHTSSSRKRLKHAGQLFSNLNWSAKWRDSEQKKTLQM